VLDREVEVLVGSPGGSAEGRLESERVDQLELLPHNHSSRRFLGLLDLEVTVIEVEVIAVLVEEEGKDALLESVGTLVRAPVHEQVLASGVAVDIAIEEDVTTLKCLSHHHLGGAILWELLHTWRDPLSVEVHAAQGRSVVSDDDAIRIEHRNDLEHEVVSEILCHLII
jgi:hypothetical protein